MSQIQNILMDLTDAEYDALFTKDKPIIFAFHGYHTLIHELTYRRTNRNIHVYGYQEEGTITTPFDMRVQNEIDRFNLVKNAIISSSTAWKHRSIPYPADERQTCCS